jgi:DNA-binding SARP family transcriptional activator
MMLRRLAQFVTRLAAGLLVIALLIVPVVVMASIAGNPFGGDLVQRITDRRVDDATLLRLLSLGFYVLWGWFALPAIRQARLCMSSRNPTRPGTPSAVPPVVVERGPQGWLARLVRYALTTSTLAAVATSTSLVFLPSVALSSPAPVRSTPTVVADTPAFTESVPSVHRPQLVSEVIAQRRDTPYSIAARLFPDRLDTARDEILALNAGRPTPHGTMYQGGTFPIGMTVLTPEHSRTTDTEAAAPDVEAAPVAGQGWLPAAAMTIERGDNLWDLAGERLDIADGPGATPTPREIANDVHEVIATNTFPSGDPNLIFAGEVYEFPAIGTPPAAPMPPPPAPTEVQPPPPASPPPTNTQPAALPNPVVVTSLPAPTHPNAAPTPTVPVSTATTPPLTSLAPAVSAAVVSDTGDSVMTLAGVTGATVLASGLAVVIARQRRRQHAQGMKRTRRTSRRAVEVERAVVAAADVPFIRWAGQELAALARRLSPADVAAVPVAVELDPESGIEILWDSPCHRAPAPWEPTDGGWSWRTLFDPDEPTPVAEWSSPIPGLVTVGTRDGRHLLIDLEHVGSIAVTGPPHTVDAWVRAAVLELGVADDLSDATVVTVGAGIDGVEHLDRVSRASPAEAVDTLHAAARDAETALAGHASLFHRRLGAHPLLGVSATVIICGDVAAEDQARIAAASRRRHGVAAILTTELDDVGARLVLDGHGAGVLHGIGDHPILVIPVGVPRETAAELAVLLDREHQTPQTDDNTTTDLQLELELVNDDATSAYLSLPESAPNSPVDQDGNLDLNLDAAAGSLADADDDWEPPNPDVLVRVLGCPSIPTHADLKEVAKRLLVFLACQNGKPVTRARVLNAVWGGEARMGKTLSNKLSEIRRSLGHTTDGDAYLPVDTGPTIRLHPAVMTDLAVFDALVRRAGHVASNDATELLREALGHVEGEPFDDAGYEWAGSTQDDYQTHDEIVDAARQLYQLSVDSGDLATARFALVQGLKGVPGHEDLYRLRMQLEHRASNTSAVHAAFSELTRQLTVLDCAPSTETVTLYRDLVGKHNP